MADRKKIPGEDEILAEARARLKEAMEGDEHNVKAAEDDLKFAWNLDNYQWPETSLKARSNRPCLTENRLPQFIRQVVNTQRENRPSITVSPVKDSSVEKAKIIEGLIRHVEQYSKADLAYDTAFESAVTCSMGYFRVTTEYCDDEGFDQDVCIRPIENAFSVHNDPFYSSPDGSDRRYCFVDEWVDRSEFKDKYGFEPTEVKEADGDDIALWFDEKRVRVAEYWRVVTERGTVEGQPGEDGQKPTREVEKKTVEQYLMTGDRIIKDSDWAGKYIPIIPVFGSVTNINGKKYRKSLIRDAKESARIINYMVSAKVEAVALQPKAPWKGPVGAFETDNEKWATANTQNHAYLQYDVVENAPPPEREQPPIFPAAFQEMEMAAIESMKAIMGLYDASLGARSNETSGIAIERRQDQGNNATFHFIDNMTRAIRYAGLVVIDLLPKVYDQPRIARIVDVDGSASMVHINGDQPMPDQNMQLQPPIDIRNGKYDVVVKAGPSFATQRQEASQRISELVKAFPPLMQMAGDLLLKNMDFPEADKIAERLAPPGSKDGIPPQIQQQMQQMQQQLQEGGQAFAKLQQDFAKAQMDSAQKGLEKVQLQTQLAQAQSADPMGEKQQELDHAYRMEQLKVAGQVESARQVALVKEESAQKQAAVQMQVSAQQHAQHQETEAQRFGMQQHTQQVQHEQGQMAAAQQAEQKAAQGAQSAVPGPDTVPEPDAAAKANEALIQTLHALHQETLQSMHKLISSPREIIRGPDGRAVGTRMAQG